MKEILLPIRTASSVCFLFPVFISDTPDDLHRNINPHELVSAHVLSQSSYTQLMAVCIFYCCACSPDRPYRWEISWIIAYVDEI
jgi:hypothetical protein